MDFFTSMYFYKSFVLPVSFALLYNLGLSLSKNLALLSNQAILYIVDTCLDGTFCRKHTYCGLKIFIILVDYIFSPNENS